MLCEINNLSKSFDKVLAVDNVTLAITEGDSIGLVGESGSGKTTLARLIMGLITPDSGEIKVNGSAQIVFQDPQTSLNPRIKIGEAIAEPMEIRRVKPCLPAGRGHAARVKELLELVGLPADYAKRYPSALSGGERQRVGVARALACEPEFLILDEPVSALDVAIQLKLLDLLKELKTKLGLTYLLIAHDLSIISYLCNKTAVMHNGRIVEFGETKEILGSPKHEYTKKLIASAL